jgi:hypothetical protein
MPRFKPADFEQLSLPVVEIYEAIERELLLNMATLLKEDKALILETDDETKYHHWRLVQLGKLGRLNRQHIATLSRYSGKTKEAVSKMLQDAGYGALMENEAIYSAAIAEGAALPAVPLIDKSAALLRVLFAYQQRAQDMFNLVNTTMLQEAGQLYRDIINKNTGMLLSGAITPQQALRRTAQEWGRHGVPALRDKAGKKWTTEAYVNMISRTLCNQVSNDMQFARMDEYGTDLIEVSSHLGARERCAPFQGRIFSRSGKSKKYAAWSSTSHGEAAGLLGINCHHVIYPYISGKSTKRYEPYDHSENQRVYEESQQQRAYERKIRKQKRELALLETLGDEQGIKESKAAIRNTQSQLRAFLDKTGRGRRRDREQIV